MMDTVVVHLEEACCNCYHRPVVAVRILVVDIAEPSALRRRTALEQPALPGLVQLVRPGLPFACLALRLAAVAALQEPEACQKHS